MLWDNDKWAGVLAQITRSSAELRQVIGEAAFQAIMHYHDHSYDLMRVRQLYETLEGAKLVAECTCFRHVINKATGIAIGEWKHSAKKLENQPELWQDVLARLQTKGLLDFYPTKATTPIGEKVKQVKADTTVKVPDAETKAALQKAVDSKAFQALPKNVQIARLRALESGTVSSDLDVIEDPEVRAAVEAYIIQVADVCKAGDPLAALNQVQASTRKMSKILEHRNARTGTVLSELKQAAAA